MKERLGWWSIALVAGWLLGAFVCLDFNWLWLAIHDGPMARVMLILVAAWLFLLAQLVGEITQ